MLDIIRFVGLILYAIAMVAGFLPIVATLLIPVWVPLMLWFG